VDDPFEGSGENYELKDLEPFDTSIFYRLFNPQVPVIVCSKFGNNVAAMPANSCSASSEKPPMVSLALRKGIRTNHIVRLGKKFSLNWISFVPKRSRKMILDLANPTKPENTREDKLERFGVPYFLIQGVPILESACAYVLCNVQKIIPTGDHDLFIASVSQAKAVKDFTADGYWRFKNYKPILYLGSIRAEPIITIN
jgi:flavin reductase (DIM6/NTAB) family NADH-FMN oxidoreductase RutF